MKAIRNPSVKEDKRNRKMGTMARRRRSQKIG